MGACSSTKTKKQGEIPKVMEQFKKSQDFETLIQSKRQSKELYNAFKNPILNRRFLENTPLTLPKKGDELID